MCAILRHDDVFFQTVLCIVSPKPYKLDIVGKQKLGGLHHIFDIRKCEKSEIKIGIWK